MMSKVLCIYHANCADGLCAAWAAVHRTLGDQVEFVAAKYGDQLEPLDSPDCDPRTSLCVVDSYRPDRRVEIKGRDRWKLR
jgi:hypothetical protein